MYKDYSQLAIEDFIFPFGTLDPNNRWVRMASLVPWDEIEKPYAMQMAGSRLELNEVDYSLNFSMRLFDSFWYATQAMRLEHEVEEDQLDITQKLIYFAEVNERRPICQKMLPNSILKRLFGS